VSAHEGRTAIAVPRNRSRGFDPLRRNVPTHPDPQSHSMKLVRGDTTRVDPARIVRGGGGGRRPRFAALVHKPGETLGANCPPKPSRRPSYPVLTARCVVAAQILGDLPRGSIQASVLPSLLSCPWILPGRNSQPRLQRVTGENLLAASRGGKKKNHTYRAARGTSAHRAIHWCLALIRDQLRADRACSRLAHRRGDVVGITWRV